MTDKLHMPETIACPEGIEVSINIFITSDSTGMDVTLDLSGMKFFVGFTGVMDPKAMAKAAGLERFATDWRPMTREEIATYKAKQAEEEALNQRAYDEERD